MDKGSVIPRQLLALATATMMMACVARAAKESPEGLNEAFKTVGRVALYRDFPSRPDALASCETHRDKACLSVYRHVRNAVALIFKDGRASALQYTLTTLTRECPVVLKQPPPPLDDSCRGAAQTLYFFRSDGEDQQIVDRLARADSAVLRGLFTREKKHQWAGDRPVPARWLPLIDRASLTEEQRNQLEKRFVGGYSHPSHIIDGKVWSHPLIHIVDPL